MISNMGENDLITVIVLHVVLSNTHLAQCLSDQAPKWVLVELVLGYPEMD